MILQEPCLVGTAGSGTAEREMNQHKAAPSLSPVTFPCSTWVGARAAAVQAYGMLADLRRRAELLVAGWPRSVLQLALQPGRPYEDLGCLVQVGYSSAYRCYKDADGTHSIYIEKASLIVGVMHQGMPVLPNKEPPCWQQGAAAVQQSTVISCT